MEEFRFSAKDGYCPSCSAFGRLWYIRDRYVGIREYEYCLMSVTEEEPMQYSFKNKGELAAWLNGDKKNTEYDDAVADFVISQHTDCRSNYYDTARLSFHDVDYIWDKKNNTLTEIQERRQETGWFDSYIECLIMAKEILKERGLSA